MNGKRDTLFAAALDEIDALMSIRRRAFCARPNLRELSLPQLHVLMTLQEAGPMTVSELAQILHISAPSASSILDRMAEHDLIERRRDTDDRRIVHVRLTDAGRTSVEEMVGMRRDAVRQVLGSMSDDDLDHIVHAVQALRRALATVAIADSAAPQEAATP